MTANPPMNDKGQILNEIDFQNYRILDGTNAIEIVRVDFSPPGDFSYLGLPALNNAGEVAFLAMPAKDPADPNLREVIFVSNGRTRKLWKRGDPAPDGNGTFAFARNDVLLNNRSEVVFNATMMGTRGGNGDNEGVFRATTNRVTQLIREGQRLPVGNGVFGGGFHLPSVNDQGQMVVFANIAQSGVAGDHGIFMADGTRVTQVARRGDPSPDGKGRFVLEPEEEGVYGESEFNNRGQVAFKAYFGSNSGPFNEEGIIFVESDGTRTLIARKGQALAGSAISSLRVLGENDDIRPINRRGGRKALSERGSVVFRATLADGRQGIFVWRKGPESPSFAGIRIVELLGGSLAFRVPSESGFRYRIQHRSSLSLGTWLDHDRLPPQDGTGAELEFSLPVSLSENGQSFYRLEVTPTW